jgi:hypothetical protein
MKATPFTPKRLNGKCSPTCQIRNPKSSMCCFLLCPDPHRRWLHLSLQHVIFDKHQEVVHYGKLLRLDVHTSTLPQNKKAYAHDDVAKQKQQPLQIMRWSILQNTMMLLFGAATTISTVLLCPLREWLDSWIKFHRTPKKRTTAPHQLLMAHECSAQRNFAMHHLFIFLQDNYIRTYN